MYTRDTRDRLDRMVDRVKPWFMVNGLAHGSRIMVLFMVWFLVQFMVWFLVHGSWWVDHKIFVSAPVPLELIFTGFDWVGAGLWGFGFWDRA